ncbi:MAG: Modification methylase MboII [Chloroflexi bacterium ADurb.Bin360]|nr:MAG: Modification methylase MboII [Chloroflexi bacterium ADurb.Bin360]
MQNLFDDLHALLAQDPRLIAQDGALLKNLTIELALKLDPDLLRLLLSHERIRQHFFVAVEGILVFDKEKFLHFVNNKAFLPDSYTAFRNKIGLSDDGGLTYLAHRRDVTLVWPYKDCVLEGGQTHEDARRDEIFWNTTLAPDDIDRLLDPKVLTGWRRYDAQGEHPVTELRPDDNFIVKGNNLLALHSLARRFGGKVKLIYIDPPYNTGTDDFGYNDRFNHSTWLTFMRNRLEIARFLLKREGAIFIQITDQEMPYLRVLLDEIFGRENFIEQVIWKKRGGAPNDKQIGAIHEYIVIYAKDVNHVQLYRQPRSEDQLSRYQNPDNHPKGLWAPDNLMANVKGGRYVKSLYYPIVNPQTGEVHYPSSDGNWRYSQEKVAALLANDEIYFGSDGKGRPKLKRFLCDVQEGVPFNTIWVDTPQGVSGTQEIKELFGSVNLFDTPKPEGLIAQVMQLGSIEGDLVLDFFLGSGTTAAVAHKMGRQYIGLEQMDYIETITVERLRMVIAGEQGGISQEIGWQGGGDFVYCELLQWNARYVQRIQDATSAAELWAIWQEIQRHGFISYRVDVAAINAHAEDFVALTLAEQQRFLLETLDYNALYVNLSEMDDADYAVSDEDKRLNAQFYGASTE